MNNLNNKDLLILCSGATTQAAERLMQYCNQSLKEIERLTIEEMQEAAGITKLQASKIVAVFNMGRRRDSETVNRLKFTASREAYEYLKFLEAENYECFYVLYLNRANILIKAEQISVGGVCGTVADPKKIFQLALNYKACGLILAHNHPSGNITPSETDIRLTRKIKEGGLILDISVMDHLIIGIGSYYSFADEGLM